MVADDQDYISSDEVKKGPPFCRRLIGEEQLWLQRCRLAVQKGRREWLNETAKNGANASRGLVSIERYCDALSYRPDAPLIARKLARVACFVVDLKETPSPREVSSESIEGNTARALTMELYSLAHSMQELQANEGTPDPLRADEFARMASRVLSLQETTAGNATVMLAKLASFESQWQLAPLRDLILYFLDQDENRREIRVNALLDVQEPMGQVVTLHLQLGRSGGGTIYPDPRKTMFFTFDEKFQLALQKAWTYAQTTFNRTDDVRWYLTHFLTERPNDDYIPFIVEGGSFGAAFALGLTHLFDDTRDTIGPDWAITGSITKTGTLEPVTGLVAKLTAAKAAKLKVIIPSETVSEARSRTDFIPDFWKSLLRNGTTSQEPESSIDGIEVTEARTINQASDIATENVRQVTRYLKLLENNLSKSPPYYPKNFNFDFARIRQKVRVRMQPSSSDDQVNQKNEFEENQAVLDWDDVKGVQRGVILGDAGFGKTWLLQYEGWCLACEQLSKLKNGEIGINEVKLPIFIRLGDLTYDLKRTSNSDDFTSAILRTVDGSAKVREVLRQSLKNNNACLLLDGLDEVPYPLRAQLKDRLEDLHCRILVSSRIVGYSSLFGSRNDESNREMEVIAFDESQIGLFVNAWFASSIKDRGTHSESAAASGDDRAGTLYDFLIDNPPLLALARIPLLLTFICLRMESDELPSGRTDLYRKILERLLQGSWRFKYERKGIGQIPKKWEILRTVAWHFAEKGSDGKWIDPMPAAELVQVIANVPEYNSVFPDANPSRLLEMLSEGDGILTRGAEPQYPGGELDVPLRFLHHTFREFLVAEYLEAQPVEAWQEVVRQHCWYSQWQDAIVLLAGMLDPERVTVLLETLMRVEHDSFKTGLFLAGECLGELKPAEQERISLAGEINRRLEKLVVSENKQDQIRASKVLARIRILSRPGSTQVSYEELLSNETNVGLSAASDAHGAKARNGLDDLLASLKWADKQSRRNLADELSTRTEAQALTALLILLKDEDRIVRQRACKALGNRRDPQSVSSLLQLILVERDNNVLSEAALALGKIRDLQATEALIGLVSRNSDFVQRDAIIALRMLADPTAETVLVKILLDPNVKPSVRAEAARALGSLSKASGINALFLGIEEKAADIRRAAIESLGNLREQRAIKVLVSLMCDPDVALAAGAALTSIAGESSKAEQVYDAAVNRLNEAPINFYKDQQCRTRIYDLLAEIAPHVCEANKHKWPKRRERAM